MTRSRTSTRAWLAAMLLPLAAVALSATDAGAQSCLGFSSFRTHPVRLGASIGSGGGNNNTTSLGLDVAFGQAQGAFGGAGLGLVDYEGTSESATTISGALGYQIPVGISPRGPQVCPVGSVGFTLGPDAGNVENRTVSLQGGFALGAPVDMTPAVRLTPFGSLSLLHLRASQTAGNVEINANDTGGIVGLGAGLIFNDRFTIRPALNIPVGFDGADTGFSLAVGLSFGGP